MLQKSLASGGRSIQHAWLNIQLDELIRHSCRGEDAYSNEWGAWTGARLSTPGGQLREASVRGSMLQPQSAERRCLAAGSIT